MAESSSVRPWQGTALGVIDIIGTVFSFLFALLFLMFQGMIASLLGAAPTAVDVNGAQIQGAQGVMAIFAGLGMVMGVVLLGFGVLGIFLARGAFKGQKWSPIVSIIFAALGIVGLLTSFSSSSVLSLVIDAFTLYVAVMCVKSPYFNKAK